MNVTIIGCPTELGLRREVPGVPSGTIHAPDALRAAGIVERLGARDSGNLPVPPYDPVRRNGVLNADAVEQFAETQAAAIGEVLDAGAFPLIVGGDCSLLLGSLRAVRRRGRYGLVFLDGHTDYYTPRTSGTGGIAGMDLHFACVSGGAAGSQPAGNGRRAESPPLHRNALVDPRHVVHLGRRDFEEARTYRGELPPEVLDLHLDVVREEGARKAAERAVAHLAELDGFFIHVDVDVLDDGFMPCVDSRQPGGLTPEELRDILRVLWPRAVAAELTIFDPTKDPEGEAARGLVSVVQASMDASIIV